MNGVPSYVQGASSVPLIGETIGANFDHIAARHADGDALIVRHQNVRWSYRELARRVDDLAVALLGLGLKPGDRIGIWSQNCAEWVLTQFATAKAGLVLVNINPAYRRVELEYALKKVGCRALVLSPSFKTSDYLAILHEVAPEIATSPPGELHAASLPELARIGERLQFDDAVNIQFTSGTTGAPKGATLTHHNILNNGFFIGEAMRFTEHDRLCIPVPLYHCFGMVLGNLACVTHGATMVFPGEGFEARAVLETVEAERCTALHGVPTMFIAALDDPEFDRYDLSTLRTGIMAGSPCPVEVMKRSEEHTSELQSPL